MRLWHIDPTGLTMDQERVLRRDLITLCEDEGLALHDAEKTLLKRIHPASLASYCDALLATERAEIKRGRPFERSHA